MNVMRLDASAADFSARLKLLLAYAEDSDEAVERSVQSILADVKARGDAAVLEYTAKFDGVKAASTNDLRVSPNDIASAFENISAASASRRTIFMTLHRDRVFECVDQRLHLRALDLERRLIHYQTRGDLTHFLDCDQFIRLEGAAGRHHIDDGIGQANQGRQLH